MRFRLPASAAALARPHRSRIALLGAASMLAGLTEAAFLVLVTRAALAIAEGEERIALWDGRTIGLGAAVAIGVAVVLARFLLTLVAAWFTTRLTIEATTAMRLRLANAYLRASWATHQQERSGRLQELMSNHVTRAVLVLDYFASAFGAALSVAAFLLVALLVDFVASLAVFGALAVLGTALAPIRRRIKGRAEAAATAGMTFATAVSELGALSLEMRAFGVRDRFADRLEALLRREASARGRAELLRQIVTPVYTTLAYGALLAGLGVAAAIGVDGLDSVGAVMLVMLRSLTYGQLVQNHAAGMVNSLPFLDEVAAMTQRYEEDRTREEGERIAAIDGLEVRDATFSYVPGHPVLEDVSFSIRRGEVVGIIGPSGSGKTTLVQLLLGLREPSSGDVLVAGVDLRKVDRRDFTSRVAFVPQEPLMFSGTVKENIVFFRSGISDAAVELAGRRAHIHDEIVAMRDGYETGIGERGGNLSGGQRQRLSIARALAGDPEVLLLDEPTSALDASSEALIRTTLGELAGRVTIVVIAHRLSTLDICDRLMVIDGGRIRGFDTPSKLAEDNEFYRRALELSGIADLEAVEETVDTPERPPILRT